MKCLLIVLLVLCVPRPAATEPPIAPSEKERRPTLDSLAAVYSGVRQVHVAYLDGDSVVWEVYRNGEVWGARGRMLSEDQWTASVSDGVVIRTRQMNGTVSSDEDGPLPSTGATISLNQALRLLSSALAIELKGPITESAPSRTVAFSMKVTGSGDREGPRSFRWSMVAGVNLRPSWLDPTVASLLPTVGLSASTSRVRIGNTLYDIDDKDGWPERVSFERADGGSQPYLRRGPPTWSPDRWEREIKNILSASGPGQQSKSSEVLLAHSALIEEGLQNLDIADPTLRTRPGDLWLCARVLSLACWGPALRELGSKSPGPSVTPMAVARASLRLGWDKPELERLNSFLSDALEDLLASPLRGGR
jgi:hypothetical protein